MMKTVSTTFSIWSPRFAAAAITDRLGAFPDREVIKGVDRIPARSLPAAHGWHLIAERNGDARAEEGLEYLLGKALAFKAQLDQLKRDDPEVMCKVTIYLDRNRADLSLNLSPQTLAGLASLNASLFVDAISFIEGTT